MKVVEGTTVEDAVSIMQEAHVNGLALVTQTSQVRPPARPRAAAPAARGPRPASKPHAAPGALAGGGRCAGCRRCERCAV